MWVGLEDWMTAEMGRVTDVQFSSAIRRLVEDSDVDRILMLLDFHSRISYTVVQKVKHVHLLGFKSLDNCIINISKVNFCISAETRP